MNILSNKKQLSLIAIIVIACGAIISYCIYDKNKTVREITSFVDSYLKMVYATERGFIESIPVYRDFATPQKELELRTYLIDKHALEVSKNGVGPMKTIKDIQKFTKQGKLIMIETGEDKLYYFHNVRKDYRYLTPHAAQGLELIAKRFQENIQKRKKLPPVKLAISSVIRTVSYQKKLFGHAFVSTHSFGASFDIFFDDYYVFLPGLKTNNQAAAHIRTKLHRQLGFMLGDSLREQFRSVLMETLLQLQQEGVLYAILEKYQRCYHISILKK